MPAFTYVEVLDCKSMTIKNLRFKKISEAVNYVKSYPCRGHIVMCVRYGSLLAFKSDVECRGFHDLRGDYNPLSPWSRMFFE